MTAGVISWTRFFMQDYMEDEQDFENGYKVKPFWIGHGWKENETTGLPKTRNEINKGLEEISRRIAARSVRIINACRNRLKQG